VKAPAAGAAKKPAAEPEVKKKSAPSGFFGVIGDYFSKGGPMMIVIFLVSLFGTGMFFERGYALYLQAKLDAGPFLDKVLRHVERREFRRALDACNAPTKHPLTAVVRAGVLRANRREKEIERALEKEMLAALPNLQKRVALMSLLANSATLLGLLGTIFGLIGAFNSVAMASAAERQEALAGGISTAMYTTAFGITVAVPLLFFHHFLSKRAENITMEIEEGASAVLVALAGDGKESQERGSRRR
jgi:biopolymer transport protein ExbB